MTPLRSRLVSAFVAALMILALAGSPALAEDGPSSDSVPYDPGLPAVYWPFAE